MVTIQHGCKMKINEIVEAWKIGDNGPEKIDKIPAGAKEMTSHPAFDGNEYQALDHLGINFIEKPSSFDYIDQGGPEGDRFVTTKQIQELEELTGRKLPSYNGHDVLNFRPIKTRNSSHIKGWSIGPLADADFDEEETFILWFPPTGRFAKGRASGRAAEIVKWHKDRNKFNDMPENKKYLVRPAANSYIRMWVAIVD